MSTLSGEEATIRLARVASIGSCSVRGHCGEKGVGCKFQTLCLFWEPVITHTFMGTMEKVLVTAGKLACRGQMGGS